MRLHKIVIDNFRCFEHLELDFDGQVNDHDTGCVDVLVAANGQGKTAVLDAIKYLLGVIVSRFGGSSPKPKDSDYRTIWKLDDLGLTFDAEVKAPFMRLMADAGFCWDLTRQRDKSEKTLAATPSGFGIKAANAFADEFIDSENASEPKKLPILAYFGTRRSVIWKKPERRRNFTKVFKRFDAYKTALDGMLDYKNLMAWVDYVEDKQRREKEALHDFNYQSLEVRTINLAISKMLTGFSNLRTTTNPLNLVVDVLEGGEKRTCTLDEQLSDGYKNVLVLVLNIVQRMIEANGAISADSPEEVLASDGIVLIDEVDLFLHPSWQQHILPDLRKTFPNIQFIVTTHSPQVVSSVDKACVTVLNGGMVNRLSRQTQGVESHQILEQVFGVSPEPPDDPFVQMLRAYARLAKPGARETQELNEMKRLLENHFGADYSPLMKIEIARRFAPRRPQD